MVKDPREGTGRWEMVDPEFVTFLILAWDSYSVSLSLVVLIQRPAQLLGETSKIYLVEFNFPANVAFALHPPEGACSLTDLNTLEVRATRRSRPPEGLVG